MTVDPVILPEYGRCSGKQITLIPGKLQVQTLQGWRGQRAVHCPKPSDPEADPTLARTGTTNPPSGGAAHPDPIDVVVAALRGRYARPKEAPLSIFWVLLFKLSVSSKSTGNTDLGLCFRD